MTRCGQSATFCGIFQCWRCLPGHICILQFDWDLFKRSCRMDCAKACPLPDQEGCHPTKHCQPPWRRQSEPEILSEFRAQSRLEDPGRFSGAGSALFRDGDLLCGKRAVRSVPEKAGGRKLLWRADVCDGAAVAQSAAGGSFFRLYCGSGAVRRKRCAGAFPDSGNFSQASGVCTLDRHRSGRFWRAAS